MAASPHRCPDGHELSSTRSPCRVCRRAQIEATLAACCPGLSKNAIAAAVSATITSPAVARDLAAALAAGPEVLAAGAPPVVARLGVELRARNARLKEPACAICGRTGRPLIRVGSAGLCGRCRAHQLARPGQALLDGADLAPVPPQRRDMGMVFQSYSLFPTMTAEENVAFGLRLRGASKASRRRRARELLELVGLGRHARHFPHQLSGGQQ